MFHMFHVEQIKVFHVIASRVPRGTNTEVYLNYCYILLYIHTVINKYIFISLLLS